MTYRTSADMPDYSPPKPSTWSVVKAAHDSVLCNRIRFIIWLFLFVCIFWVPKDFFNSVSLWLVQMIVMPDFDRVFLKRADWSSEW